MSLRETIVAISSAVGEAGRMIVRLSGPMSRDIAMQLGGSSMPAPGVSREHLTVDELRFPAWVYFFAGPRSYTGEDVIEFHLPGNPLLGRMTLDACLAAGARSAEAGEFTARAYFNGRLGLAEADGVAAIIAAQNDSELAAGQQLMAGELARRLSPAMDLLADTLALVEVGIDFVDENVTFLSSDQIAARARRIHSMLAELLASSAELEKLTHEPRVVLVGRPNAGKSTLFNALAGWERAVVSPIAGTTRDAISAKLLLRRGEIELIDVAGLDAGLGVVEQEMQSQRRRAVESADVVVLVQDVNHVHAAPSMNRDVDLVVTTKADLLRDSPVPWPAGTTWNAKKGSVRVSALTGQGMDELRASLDEIAFGVQTPAATLALTSRHRLAIAEAMADLDRASSALAAELIAAELREALDALGQVLGIMVPDDLLGRIFGKFCIGK